MGFSYYFLEEPGPESAVLQWFRQLDMPPEEVDSVIGKTLYFRELGALEHDDSGKLILEKSPLVLMASPHIRRGALWTAGEVHFVLTPQSLSPTYAAVRKSFARWLSSFPEVFSQSAKMETPADYYLEGALRNVAPKIYALPSGTAALEAERYFVAYGDNDSVLDTLTRKLKLRGVELT